MVRLRGRSELRVYRERAVVSHISRKTSEMWGTRGFVVKTEEKTHIGGVRGNGGSRGCFGVDHFGVPRQETRQANYRFRGDDAT